MQPANPLITLTAAALAHLRQAVPVAKQPYTVRLALKKTGCSGFSYHLEPSEPQPGDEIIQASAEVTLVIASELLPKLSGTTIDYARNGLNSGFKYFNPHEKGSCGCGESVSL